MLKGVRSAGIYVSDQQRALDLVTRTLSCKPLTDQPMEPGAEAPPCTTHGQPWASWWAMFCDADGNGDELSLEIGTHVIVEYARYRVPPEQARAVIDAYDRAGAALEASPHCLRYEVGICVEDRGAVVVRIEWDSVEGHLSGFRRSAAFREFRQAVRPYIGAIEEMRHYGPQLPRVPVSHQATNGQTGDRDHPRAVVERFLAANAVLDVAGMFEEIGEHAVSSFPAAPRGAPREVRGKATNRSFFESLLPMWTSFSLPQRGVHALADDPDRVVAYYASSGSLIDGSPYGNSYLSLVTVRGGKIVHWIEFCDAEPLTRGVTTLTQTRGQ